MALKDFIDDLINFVETNNHVYADGSDSELDKIEEFSNGYLLPEIERVADEFMLDKGYNDEN